MIPGETRSRDWLSHFLGSCDRLVHARVADEAERASQARLMATQFVAPFIQAGAIGPAVLSAGGGSASVAAVASLFALSFANIVLLATTGRRTPAAAAALLQVVGFGALGVWLGAPAGLIAMLAVAIAAESAWVGQSRRAVAGGLMLAAPLLAASMIVAGPADAVASVLGIAVSLLYAATLLPRLADLVSRSKAVPGGADDLAAKLDAVVLRLTREGEVLSASHQVRRLLRLEPDLLTGSALFERIRVSDRVKFLCALSAEEPAAIEISLRIPGERAGEVAHLDVTLEFVRSEGDGWTAILRSAGELAALRAALDEANDQAAALEIAKSRFLAAVSHELRTPLNAIIGFSDMLLHEDVSGRLPEKQAEHVGLIREAGNHLLSVVNSILDISKIEAGAYPIQPEPFALQSAIDLTVSLMEQQAGDKGVALTTHVGGDVGEVLADQRAVQQILLNLIANAVKFTPAGGSVAISAQRLAERLEIAIADTGIGISPDDLANLGRPFTQVQNDYTRNFEGTGLGLSLVKGLVGLHHGDLRIESAPGEGTTVTVALPLGREAAVTLAETQTSNGYGHGAHETYRKIA